jgi:hypothetical protein
MSSDTITAVNYYLNPPTVPFDHIAVLNEYNPATAQWSHESLSYTAQTRSSAVRQTVENESDNRFECNPGTRHVSERHRPVTDCNIYMTMQPLICK